LTDSTPKKILFVGLDNGGKTSIVKSLTGTKNLPSFSSIPPTRGESQVRIKLSDSEFSIWDLGGQEAFREEYLADFDKYLFGCSKLIYVFDIQDTKRYDLAMQYFEKIIDFTVEKLESNNIELSIYFHKFDPDLKRDNITDDIVNGLKDKVKAKLDNTNLFYQIFLTTIYAIFEKIVID
jgi:small GTP-binding protein